MAKMFDKQAAKDRGPVECLGKTFPDDNARREHYLAILAEKLKDPEFRKIEGFPIGSDEDILALSDPPYYTACPNPFLADFIKHYGKPYDPKVPYSREPFAADVSEGKNDPVYLAHSYHTKVPHKAIMRYILHYTEPGDVVLDGFCGTGMTGIAAYMCGSRETVEGLGLVVGADGAVTDRSAPKHQGPIRPLSHIGVRNSVLNDLSPVATFIAANYNSPIEVDKFEHDSAQALALLDQECAWMYKTSHSGGPAKGTINYTVWSDVFVCPECTSEIVFWDAAVDKASWQVRDDFCCPTCNVKVGKRNLERVWVSYRDETTGAIAQIAKQVPTLIHYKYGGKTYTKVPDLQDFELLSKIEDSPPKHWYPHDALPNGDKVSDPLGVGVTSTSKFYTRRALLALSAYASFARSSSLGSRLMVNLTSSAIVLSRQYRFRSQGGSLGAGGGPMNGTLYVPSLYKEIPVPKVLGEHAVRMAKLLRTLPQDGGLTSTGSFACLPMLPSESVDYVFVDPPFGSNIMYSELNFVWESWLRVRTNNVPEAIENRSQRKGSIEYRELMTKCFSEAYRVLKPGRWMTVEFSNTKAAVWNSIQTALSDAGFIVANVSALDKQQGSFNAVNNTTSVKQDLVISAYKPNGGFEARFGRSAETEEGVWEFVRTHLKYLPVVKVDSESSVVPIAERDPRILYDQMVAYFVRKGYLVPLDSVAFQEGLSQRFVHRDGMYFLADQASAYEKASLSSARAGQRSLFVSDESTAIIWLRQLLKDKPQTFQDVNPQFIKQLGGWQKHERALELSELLAQNFFRYDGKGEVPGQIHSYLSSNFKELRKLAKDAPELRAKAKDRWYVPDPSKAGDLERLRERALLKEFWDYMPPGYKPVKLESPEGYIPGLEPKAAPIPRGKKMKVIRLEAVRAGFKHCWQNRDYRTIIAVAQRIPENVLQEDPKLLMWYDQAQTRMGGDE